MKTIIPRNVIVLAMVITFYCAARGVAEKPCEKKMPDEATALTSWTNQRDKARQWPDLLYKSFKAFRECDDGFLAEAYSQTVANVLLRFSETAPQLHALSKKDPDFHRFVMKHVDNTVSPNTLKALWETALKECPPDGHDFCSAIMERSAEAIRESETGDPNEAAFPDPWIKKQVLILMSTRDYQAALKRAAEAAAALALRLKTNDLKADRTLGLTWPKEKCENSGWGYPCYPSRGRYDDGAFVSVEYSSAFGGFKPGFYIVVAAMESANSQEFVPATLKKARTAYPDAYVKTTPVYMGCMH